jgi:Carbohydrate-binding family 9
MIHLQRLMVAFGICLVVAVSTGSGGEPGSPFKPPAYEVRRAGSPIVIDGYLDEPAWVAAPTIGEFSFPWWKEGKKERTVVKLLWDDKNLYVAHICEDAHITAHGRPHDDARLPDDDVFEIMLAPNADKPNVYFNIEWNVLGSYVDNFRPNGPKMPRAKVWDAEGVRIAGSYVGTLNDDRDADKYWIGEVAIPFRNFVAVAGHASPRVGESWNVNFNRHGGKINLQYSQWSPGDSPTPAFHTPHRFGRITFTAAESPFGNR